MAHITKIRRKISRIISTHYSSLVTRYWLSAFTLLLLAVVHPQNAFAALNLKFKLELPNPIEPIESFADLGAVIFKAVTIVAIPLTVVFFIWGGILFVTARGNEQQISKAKKAFFWALVGALIIVASWAIALALTKSAEEF